MIPDNMYTIQEMINKIKQVGFTNDPRLDEIEKTFQEKRILSTQDVIYLKKQISILTSGREKYKKKVKDETKKIVSVSKEIGSKISDEVLHKSCVRCGTNLLKKQIVKHGESQRSGSTFMLSKRQRNSLKRNVRANIEKFVKHNLSKKVCDACYYEIIYDTKIYDIKCTQLSNKKQDIDGYIFLQNFDETKIIFGDNKGRDFKIIPTSAIKNYQIMFADKTSNYRKIRDDLSFILFNRSEKEKQERILSSDLKSIDTKSTELLSLDFTENSGMNRLVIKCKELYDLYGNIKNICKNKMD